MKSRLVLINHTCPFGGEDFLRNELELLPDDKKILLFPILLPQISQDTPLIRDNVEVSQIGSKPALFDFIAAALSSIVSLITKGELAAALGHQQPCRNVMKALKFACRSESRARVIAKYLKRGYSGETFLFYSYWFYETAYVAARLKKMFPGSRFISRCHGYDLYEIRHANGYLPYRGYLMEHVDRIYPVSDDGKNYMHHIFQAKWDDKIEVARLGTSPGGTNPSKQEDCITLVSCSNFVEVKRVERIARALKTCQMSIHWYHIGDGPMREKIEKEITFLPGNLQVDLLGAMPNRQVLKFYCNHHVDVFINVSESEGIPVSVMEAMSFAIPVIATDVGGTHEIVADGINGVLLRKDFSDEELIHAIQRVTAPKEREEFGKRALSIWQEKCDANKVYQDFYRELEKNGGRSVMPGFFVSNQELSIALNNMYPERCVAEEIQTSGTTIKRNTLNKFMLDKAFEMTERAVIVSEGYLLNKTQLYKKYQVDSVGRLIWAMYETEGETFFQQFRGAFSGAIYDKGKNVWLVYTNHIGDHAVFYYTDKKGIFFAGSQVNYIIDACNEERIKMTFDEQAAYQMLTFGFMEGNDTYAQEIKRLRGGTYLYVHEGHIEVREYHTFHKNPSRFEGMSEEQIIDAMDSAFRYASQLEYEKDDEYGLAHLADLSGGLDSRMNMWVAHEIKPRHLQLITYCKANYLDEIIAKKIAKYWDDEILVKALDDASFLYDVDKIVAMNGGLSLYSGITGGMRMLEQINMDLYGLEHSGQINGVVIGSYYTCTKDAQRNTPSGKYSEKLSKRLNSSCHALYDDHELYLLYTRGFRGIMNTQLIRSNFTEVCTTAAHTDFLQLCLDIPVELRIGHKIYKKWILAKYPQAAQFKWEKTNAKITENQYVGFVRKVITKGPFKLLRILGQDKYINTGMNPLDFWLAKNQTLSAYLDNYFRDGLKQLMGAVSEELVSDMEYLFRRGTAFEKAMVLTVVGAYQLYFRESRQ